MTEDSVSLLEALKDLDLKTAMKEAFGKCPTCGKPASHGLWLKWCRQCHYVAPINRSQLLEE